MEEEKEVVILIEKLIASTYTVETLELAINTLKGDVLTKAKFYRGDLLMTILSVVDKEFWVFNPKYKNQVLTIIDHQFEIIQNEEVSFEMKVDWYGKIEKFKRIG